MSNNPGKKGKPAPWILRARDHKFHAEEQFRIGNHPAYARHSTQRADAGWQFRDEAEVSFLGMHEINARLKMSDRALKKWDKANPSPLTWDEHQRLRSEFESQYVAPDFS